MVGFGSEYFNKQIIQQSYLANLPNENWDAFWELLYFANSKVSKQKKPH